MAKQVYDGNTLRVAGGTAGIASGDVVVVGKILGVAPYAIPAGATGIISVSGIFELPKASATVVSAGAVVYYDATAGEIKTTGNTAYIQCGKAAADAASGSTTVLVRLD